MTPEELARRFSGRGSGIRHLYLHLPFCERICPYCDFSTAVGAEADVPAFFDALKGEVRLLTDAGLAGSLDLEGGTLFLGGGTPSWFEPADLESLLHWLREVAPGPWAEATIEMNPEDADPDRLEVLRAGGITRLSLGAQSLSPSVLRRLGRTHTPGQARQAVRASREAGFSTSVDLIFAVPDQEMEEWKSDVEEIVDLEPRHISLYNLTYESGTLMERWRASGSVTPLGESWEAEAYAWAVDRLRSAGFVRYEVSNFALPGFESSHNQAYWSGADYLGVGPSAHSLLSGVRTANAFGVTAWSGLIGEGQVPWETVEVLDGLAIAREHVLLGLRTDRGFELAEIPSEHRDGVEKKAGEAVASGLAGWRGEGGRLALTDRGMLLADELAARIAP